MEIVAFIFSVIAICLSLLTFYWRFIRNVKKIYFVRVTRMGMFFRPEFALVNAGSKDILLTDLLCGFATTEGEPQGTFWPEQRIDFESDGSLLIPAGKSKHFMVEFIEKAHPGMTKQAIKEESDFGDTYWRDVQIDISWVDNHGKDYRASIKPSRYGFNKEGKIAGSKPLLKKWELYKHAKS